MTDQAEEESYLSTAAKTEDDYPARGLRACRSPATASYGHWLPNM